jgi:hypothetical protein
MKIAFGIIVFNGEYVLRECLESVYPYANQILVAEGPVKFWQEQGYTTSFDRTNDILDNFPDPDNKITIIHSQYSEKDEQANAYMKFLKNDNDYIWNLDSDEIFKPEDIEKIIDLLDKEKYTTVGFKSLSFYGGFDRYITGFEESVPFIRIRKVYPGSYWATHRPPTIQHIVSNTLPEKNLDFNFLYHQYGIRMYHYSYVYPDQVFNKIKYYENTINKNGTIPNYFKNIYLPWVISTSDDDKIKIEKIYDGVHEFLPHMRTPTYTQIFKGKHPINIEKKLDELKNNFNNQLNKYL